MNKREEDAVPKHDISSFSPPRRTVYQKRKAKMCQEIKIDVRKQGPSPVGDNGICLNYILENKSMSRRKKKKKQILQHKCM